MKRRTMIGLACGALTALAIAPTPARARDANYMPYSKMAEKADLIVIAKVKKSTTLAERSNLFGIEVVGVETVFTPVAVFKNTANTANAGGEPGTGSGADGDFVLYHYWLADPNQAISDGPTLVNFDPAGKAQYLLFLRRNGDRYEPLTGQYDADFSVEQLRFPADN